MATTTDCQWEHLRFSQGKLVALWVVYFVAFSSGTIWYMLHFTLLWLLPNSLLNTGIELPDPLQNINNIHKTTCQEVDKNFDQACLRETWLYEIYVEQTLYNKAITCIYYG